VTTSRAGFPLWLRLQFLLGGIVLAVAAIRTVEMAQIMGLSRRSAEWSSLLAVEAAIWLGWTIWVAAITPLLRRLVEPALPIGRKVAVLAVLVVAPVLLVPLVASPVHWSVFGGSSTTIPAAWLHMVRHNAVTNFLVGATLVGVGYSYLSVQRSRLLEVTAARLNTQLADAQLDTLRAQLDPHFLFNALNSISVLARRGQVQEVDQMVGRLAGLLRHSLESSRAQLVTLRVELAALRQYLEIEQVRHGNRLVAGIDVPDQLLDQVVPSFLLQPLVENAIRHGLTDPVRPLHVDVRAVQEAQGLTLTITDDGAGLPGRGDPSDGIGLGATRARLAGLYQGRASLVLASGPAERGVRVTVVLPLPS
jgi:sensor histidine kinase YesM